MLNSVVYHTNETGLPDIAAPMVTQIRGGKSEIHPKIKEIAQRLETKKTVAEYFRANLIPNIPQNVLSTVLDEIDTLIQGDKGLGQDKRKALKQARHQCKDGVNYLADVWVLAICNGKNKIDVVKQAMKASDVEFGADTFGEVLDKLDAVIAKLPRPPSITPPVEIEEHELEYITALYAAYGDAEGVSGFNEAMLVTYPAYREDLDERRIDYFAAESVNRGVSELGNLSNQFEKLKEDTYAGVANTARKPFNNGYERMLSVMEQATLIQVAQYILSRSPYWINNRIRMGACHFLVKDGKLKWVKK